MARKRSSSSKSVVSSVKRVSTPFSLTSWSEWNSHNPMAELPFEPVVERVTGTFTRVSETKSKSPKKRVSTPKASTKKASSKPKKTASSAKSKKKK